MGPTAQDLVRPTDYSAIPHQKSDRRVFPSVEIDSQLSTPVPLFAEHTTHEKPSRVACYDLVQRSEDEEIGDSR